MSWVVASPDDRASRCRVDCRLTFYKRRRSTCRVVDWLTFYKTSTSRGRLVELLTLYITRSVDGNGWWPDDDDDNDQYCQYWWLVTDVDARRLADDVARWYQRGRPGSLLHRLVARWRQTLATTSCWQTDPSFCIFLVSFCCTFHSSFLVYYLCHLFVLLRWFFFVAFFSALFTSSYFIFLFFYLFCRYHLFSYCCYYFRVIVLLFIFVYIIITTFY